MHSAHKSTGLLLSSLFYHSFRTTILIVSAVRQNRKPVLHALYGFLFLGSFDSTTFQPFIAFRVYRCDTIKFGGKLGIQPYYWENSFLLQSFCCVYFITDINRRTKIAWGCFRKFSTELFDRPNAPLRLKARLLKAEAMEALLYGCMTWAPRNAHYRQLRTTHHKLLLRVIGYNRVHGTYRKMSCAKALKKTGSQSVEATIHQRRLLFAGT